MTVENVRGQTKKSNIGGPMWLLQLWLYTIIEGHLTNHAPKDLSRSIGGIWLCYLSFNRSSKANKENIINSSVSSTPFLLVPVILDSPFVNREEGPKWFPQPIMSHDPPTLADISIWSNFLHCQLFIVSYPGASDGLLQLHLPNLVARQLGIYQAILSPFLEKAKEHFINGHVNDPKEYKHIFYKNKRHSCVELTKSKVTALKA